MPSQHLLVCAHLCGGTGRSLSTVSPTGCTFFKKVLKNIEMFPQCTTLAWKHQPSDEWVPDLVWEMAGARCGSAETKYTCLWIAFSFFLFLTNKLVQVSMFSKHTCYPGFWHCTLYHTIKHSSCFAKSFKSKKAFVPEFQVYWACI